MVDISRIFALIKITAFGISILLGFVYSLPILFVRRFHNHLNILTINITVAMICCSVYYMIYFIMWEYYIEHLFTIETCTFLFYVQSVCSCLLPFSFVILTINRYCSVVYPGKALFKTKNFVGVCIASQWIVVCVISLPFLFEIQPYCSAPHWLSVYSIVTVVIVPMFISLIFNIVIFKYVNSSTLRVRPKNDGTAMNVTMGRPERISRRDMHLVRHAIFMFSIFIFGWGPIFLLVAIDYSGNVIPLVYTILQLLAVISSVGCMLNLFFYNRDVTRYIKQKLCPCF